ncbi:hypothetical protein HDU67_009765 [Dinochytrium kinnereticum]|nr:hypothetical protein HDU67_009765 [Dinochytrium kinnereticum]
MSAENSEQGLSNFKEALYTDNWLSKVDMANVVHYTFVLIGYMDIAYILIALLQHYIFSGYPDKKWRKTNVRFAFVIVHIIFGTIVIYTGTIFCFLLEYRPGWVTETLTKRCAYVLGISQLFHAVTCLHMNRFVYGNRKITVPIYYGATAICVITAVTLLMDPTDKRALLNAWAGMNIFIFVRFQYALLSLCQINQNELYTYATSSAGLILLPFTGQNPYFILFYAGPVLLGNPYTWFKWDFLATRDLKKSIYGDEEEEATAVVVANFVKKGTEKASEGSHETIVSAGGESGSDEAINSQVKTPKSGSADRVGVEDNADAVTIEVKDSDQISTNSELEVVSIRRALASSATLSTMVDQDREGKA